MPRQDASTGINPFLYASLMVFPLYNALVRYRMAYNTGGDVSIAVRAS